jgi:hypothetical protein
MNDVVKERNLTTAEIAETGRSDAQIEAPPQRPPAARSYEEPPRRPAAQEGPIQLFSGDEAQKFRTEWTEIQAGFVDEPRGAVENADGLVARVVQRLAEVFADERAKLEKEWARGADVSTEDLRLALQRYRSFFDRLLSV